MSEVLTELVAKITADASGLKKTLGEAEREVEKSGRTIAGKMQSWVKGNEKSLNTLAKGFAAASAAIIGGLTLSVRSFAQTGHELDNLSKQTGFSTETLSILKFAAERTGTSLGAITTNAKYLSLALVEAKDSGSQAAKSFQGIGVSVLDLRKLSPEDQFMKVAYALSNVKDQSQKVYYAQQLFGRSSAELIPLLAGGTAGLAAFEKAARKAGIVMDKDTAAKAEMLDLQLGFLGARMEGIKFTIAEAIAPSLLELADNFAGVLDKIASWIKDNPKLIKQVGELGIALGLLAIGVKAVTFAMNTNPIVLAITALVVALWFLYENWDSVVEKFNALSNWWQVTQFTITTNVRNAWQGFANFWIGVWDSIVTWTEDRVNNLINILNTLIGWVNTALSLLQGLGINWSIGSVPSASFAGSSRDRQFESTFGNASYTPDDASYAGSFASGGIVPGALGQPVPIIAHGGERFAGVGKSMGETVNIYVSGNVWAERDLAQILREALLDTKNRNVNTGIS
jgi:TP901 family phage tail tape measure protein